MMKQELPKHTKMEAVVGMAFDCLNGKSSGFSVDRDLNTPKGGYMVAGELENEHKVTNPKEARVVVERLFNQLLKGEYLGAWMHEGVLYLEQSYNIQDLKKAKYTASILDQIAIWDVENNEEITLKK